MVWGTGKITLYIILLLRTKIRYIIPTAKGIAIVIAYQHKQDMDIL